MLPAVRSFAAAAVLCFNDVQGTILEKEKGREGESTSDTSFGKVEDPRRFISWMKRENNRSIEYLTGGIERLTRA